MNTLDPLSQADQALVKLNNDNERRTLLSQLQVLFVEEISLINAETWVAMDHILRKLKNNDSSFGGVAVIANGDCCQLPNITGQNIFTSSSFLFNFDYHFFKSFVRMIDPAGQALLKLVEKRPLETEEIEKCVNIISKNCNFASDWNSISQPFIMKVFGKRVAEKECFNEYCEKITGTGLNHTVVYALDEVSPRKSHLWQTGSSQVRWHKNLFSSIDC